MNDTQTVQWSVICVCSSRAVEGRGCARVSPLCQRINSTSLFVLTRRKRFIHSDHIRVCLFSPKPRTEEEDRLEPCHQKPTPNSSQKRIFSCRTSAGISRRNPRRFSTAMLSLCQRFPSVSSCPGVTVFRPTWLSM